MARYNVTITLPKGTSLEAEHQTEDVVTTSTDNLSEVEFDVFEMKPPTRGWVSMLGSRHVSVRDVVDLLKSQQEQKPAVDEVVRKAFVEVEKLIDSLPFTAPEDVDRKVRDKVGYIVGAVVYALTQPKPSEFTQEARAIRHFRLTMARLLKFAKQAEEEGFVVNADDEFGPAESLLEDTKHFGETGDRDDETDSVG